MSGLSRSEQRQIEAAIKASGANDKDKDDSDSDEDTPMSKKVAVAPKKPAGKTVGGKTVGGKSLGGKTVGGKTVGGKSLGGKTVGGKTVGGKSLGGKTLPKKRSKQVSSSEESSEDSDNGGKDARRDSSSSDSEEEEEEEEAPRAVPMKKRAKTMPATPAAHDSDSSDYEDDFDDDLYMGPDDRSWMLSLNELERENIISERKLKRELAKEAWLLQHKKKKEAAKTAGAAGGRSRARVTKPDEKKQQKFAALEDMSAKKQGASEKAKRARVVQEEESDNEPAVSPTAARSRKDEEEAPAPRGEKGPKPRHKTVEAEYIADYPKIDFDRMERVRVSRDKLIENAREPFFSEFVQGLYCRINLGTNDTGEARYLMCEIQGVREKDEKSFTVQDPRGGGTIKLSKYLYVNHAGSRKQYPLSLISNKRFEAREVDQWCRDMSKNKDELPDRERLKELEEQLGKRWKEEFKYDQETVESMLDEKRKRVSGTGKVLSGNLILSKIQLQDEKEVLWEAYQELHDRTERQEAYEKWDKVREQLEKIEEEETARKATDMKMAIMGNINSRNLEANRTIKTVATRNLHTTNITTCRPYVRKEYFAFGQDDSQKAGGGVARLPKDKQPTNKANCPDLLAFEKTRILGEGRTLQGMKALTHKNTIEEEEEEEVVEKEDTVADLAATHDALKRAHATEIKVDVEALKEGATKTGDNLVPFARAVNPLKPQEAARPKEGAKVALSLEEYKRRRNLA